MRVEGKLKRRGKRALVQCLEPRTLLTATLIVNTDVDTNVPDNKLSLREAILLAGGNAAQLGGLGRPLTVFEEAQISGATFLAGQVVSGLGQNSTDTIKFDNAVVEINAKDYGPNGRILWNDDRLNGQTPSGRNVVIDFSEAGFSHGFSLIGDRGHANEISNLSIVKTGNAGIFAQGLQGGKITGLELISCGTSGISVGADFADKINSRNNTISQNTILHGPLGIYLIGSRSFDYNAAVGMNNKIDDNVIGLENAGSTTDAGVSGCGIQLVTADRNVIGGTAGNVIAFSGTDGVRIEDGRSNFVSGNFIGLNSNFAPVGNKASGVALFPGSNGNTISSNFIQSNHDSGIYMSDSDGNTIAANVIDGNGINGVSLVEGSSGNLIGGSSLDGAGNVIINNANAGVDVADSGTDNNVISANFIGTDSQTATGTGAAPNREGVQVRNGAHNTQIGNANAEPNIISGNSDAGIAINDSATTGTLVVGNRIGTSRNGALALGNGGGIVISGSPNNTIGGTGGSGVSNLICANEADGIIISGSNSTGNSVLGNYIGVNSSGVKLGNGGSGVWVTAAAHGNLIGSTATSQGNVIGDNKVNGVTLFSTAGSSNLVLGNWIGTDPSKRKLPNHASGVRVSSAGNTIGSATGSPNVICFNENAGIELTGADAASTLVRGNYIGTFSDGTGKFGNTGAGILLSSGAHDNRIGNGAGAINGDSPLGNLIKWNGHGGVVATANASNGNIIAYNRIDKNVGPGIDLNDDGPTPNDSKDPDSGPNTLQNYPVLSAVTVPASGQLKLVGTIRSTPSTTFRLDFYRVALPDDDSKTGEGFEHFLFKSVTTDANGVANFSFQGSNSAVGAGAWVTGTATGAGGTSEFSPALKAVIPSVQLTGNVIGTTGAYNNSTSTRDKAFDGDLLTFFNAPAASGAWTGLDLGATKVITSIKFAPRGGWAARMVDGKFQASNSADFSSGVVDLFTVQAPPPVGSLTTQTISNTSGFRYVRYIGATSNYCNVAEIQFFGHL